MRDFLDTQTHRVFKNEGKNGYGNWKSSEKQRENGKKQRSWDFALQWTGCSERDREEIENGGISKDEGGYWVFIVPKSEERQRGGLFTPLELFNY